MLVAIVALVTSQVLLALLLFGTVAMDRERAIDQLVERHPLVPGSLRQRRALVSYRNRLDRLGAASQRARSRVA